VRRLEVIDASYRDERESLFLQHREFIERTVRSICSRRGIFGDDADDVVGDVMEKFVRDDYLVLEKYRGDGNIEGFIRATVAHRVLDWLNKELGKWRSSAAARRLGREAVLLERLVYRDGLTWAEAITDVLARDDVGLTRRRLARLARKIPIKAGRRKVALEHILNAAIDDLTEPPPHQDAMDTHRSSLLEAVQAELARLDPEDQLIARMRFVDRFRVKDISESLQIKCEVLYQRIYTLRRRLKACVQECGPE